MDTIEFPAWWQRRWGWSTSAFLSYLIEVDDDAPTQWFSADINELRQSVTISHASISVARERLKADGVIEARKAGISYEYRIIPQQIEQLANAA